MKKFFTINDDFKNIIISLFPSAKKVRQVSTGWTNFVYIASVKGQKYVFRFPRNDFFRKVLKKESRFCRYLKTQGINITTPNMSLYYNNGRVFSVHEMIRGKSLTKTRLLPYQKRKLAHDCCEFLKALSQLKCNQRLPRASTFLRNLSYVSADNYNLLYHKTLEKIERREKIGVTHGDFNPGNLIIRKGVLVGVLDFAFVSKSSPLNDLARIIGRLPVSYRKYFIDEFQKVFHCIVNYKELTDLERMWEYIEKKYIVYIKKMHPDIELPKKYI